MLESQRGQNYYRILRILLSLHSASGRIAIVSLFLLKSFFLVGPLWAAEPILMVRSQLKAPDAMAVLQETLKEYGYQIAHVQRCDGGMAEFHYPSDFYRVVFFGKLHEVRPLLKKYPELAPFIPLKIAVVAENEESFLAALNPTALGPLLTDAPDLQIQLQRWYQDIHSILNEVHVLAP